MKGYAEEACIILSGQPPLIDGLWGKGAVDFLVVPTCCCSDSGVLAAEAAISMSGVSRDSETTPAGRERRKEQE